VKNEVLIRLGGMTQGWIRVDNVNSRFAVVNKEVREKKEKIVDQETLVKMAWGMSDIHQDKGDRWIGTPSFLHKIFEEKPDGQWP